MTNLYIVAYSLADIVNPYIVPFSFAVIIAVVVLLAVLADNSSSKQRQRRNEDDAHPNHVNNTIRTSIRSPLEARISLKDIDWDDPRMNSLMDQFLCCATLKWRECPNIEDVASLVEIFLFEIAMQAISHNAEHDALVRDKATIMAVSILKGAIGSHANLYTLEKVYKDRYQAYRRVAKTAKKYVYLYSFFQWASKNGHINAVSGNYEPIINIGINNIPMDDFIVMKIIDDVSLDMNSALSATFDTFLMTGGIADTVKSIIDKHTQATDNRHENIF